MNRNRYLIWLEDKDEEEYAQLALFAEEQGLVVKRARSMEELARIFLEDVEACDVAGIMVDVAVPGEGTLVSFEMKHIRTGVMNGSRAGLVWLENWLIKQADYADVPILLLSIVEGVATDAESLVERTGLENLVVVEKMEVDLEERSTEEGTWKTLVEDWIRSL